MAKRLVQSAGCGNVIGISTETSPDDRELRLIWEIPVYTHPDTIAVSFFNPFDDQEHEL